MYIVTSYMYVHKVKYVLLEHEQCDTIKLIRPAGH